MKIAHSSGLVWSFWLVVMKPSGTFCRGTLTYTHPALLPFSCYRAVWYGHCLLPFCDPALA